MILFNTIYRVNIEIRDERGVGDRAKACIYLHRNDFLSYIPHTHTFFQHVISDGFICFVLTSSRPCTCWQWHVGPDILPFVMVSSFSECGANADKRDDYCICSENVRWYLTTSYACTILQRRDDGVQAIHSGFS